MIIDYLEFSSVMALIGIGCLTSNFILGILVRNKYTVKLHKKIALLKIHKLTAYTSVLFILVHIILIPFAKDSGFTWKDLLFPLWTIHQPYINLLGAIAFYLILIVTLSSLIRKRLKYSLWRTLHYLSFVAIFPMFIHALWTDTELKERPVDWLDAEKVFIEVLALIIVGLMVHRFRPRRATH